MANDRLLTTSEVGTVLHLSPNRVLDLIRDGLLKGVIRGVPKKKGRPRKLVRESDLNRYLANLADANAEPEAKPAPRTIRRSAEVPAWKRELETCRKYA